MSLKYICIYNYNRFTGIVFTLCTINKVPWESALCSYTVGLYSVSRKKWDVYGGSPGGLPSTTLT